MASLPEPLRVWGLRRNPNNVRAWEKIAIGDTALFYANKAYRYAGVVRHKWQDSSGIPLAAHGPASDDLFPLQFVVTDLRECLLSIADYNDLRGYKPGYFPADPHVGSGDDAVAVLNAIGLAVLDDTEIVTALSAEGQRKISTPPRGGTEGLQ